MADDHGPGTILEVSAGPHDRKDVFVSWPCSGGCGCGGSHTLKELDDDGNPCADVPCQCVLSCGCGEEGCEDECGEMVWMISELKAGQTKRYLVGEGASDGAEGVTVEIQEGEQADIKVGGELFTSYLFNPEKVVRPYCWPVVGPQGSWVTNCPTTDHPHHKSMYVAQGDTNGVNNWDEMEGHGFTRNLDVQVLAEGPVYGELVAVGDWEGAKGNKVLQEITRIRVYNTPDNARIMDWDITWWAAYGGVFIGDTKEAGTLSVRVAQSMEVRNGGTIQNAYGGINDDECWGKRAPWVDYFGPVDSGVAGITLMDHPDNLRFPTYWHVRGYGLFTANQWGIHDFTDDFAQRGDLAMEEGDALNFLFRVYIHDGDTAHADCGSKWLDFAFPPTVKVVE